MKFLNGEINMVFSNLGTKQLFQKSEVEQHVS